MVLLLLGIVILGCNMYLTDILEWKPVAGSIVVAEVKFLNISMFNLPVVVCLTNIFNDTQ